MSFLGLYGCATVQGGAPNAPTVPAVPKSSPSKPLTLEQLVVSQTTAETLAALHKRGLSRFEQHDFISAESDFNLCVEAQPEGPLAASCLYYSGLANDEMRHYELALKRLQDLSNRFPEHTLALPAQLRALRLATHLERWDIAAQLAERLLIKRKSLKPFELILPYGVLAMKAVLRNDDGAAEQLVARARTLIEQYELDVPGKIHRDLAVVYFALGELRRLRAERLVFVPLPTDFADVLERRCQLILDAQSAYSDAMRAYDAHWSTMAGYRVAQLYSTLHVEVMRMVENYPEVDLARRQLFEGAMRLRYDVLTKKAQNMLQHTLDMAKRAGEQSEWVERAKLTSAELARQSQAEEDAINRLPYSREALTYALAKLSQSAAAARPTQATPKASTSHAPSSTNRDARP